MRRRPVRRLRVVHASGKWSGNARRFARYLKRASRRADVITTTESKGMRDTIAAVLGAKWEVRIEGEFVVAVRRTVGSLGPGRLAVLSDEFSGSSDWRDTRAHVRWIRVRGFGPVLVVVSHLSSAVQEGDQWSGFRAGVDSHDAATRWIGRLVARRERLAPDAAVIFCTDANLHLGMPVWRRRMNGNLRMTGMWDVRAPKRGTHGSRTIDSIFSNRRIERPFVGPKAPKGFDHRLVRCRVVL